MARKPPASARAKAAAERPSIRGFRQTSLQELFWDLLTFDRLMTGPVIHLIYWAGLAVLVLGGFSIVGGAVGLALREPGFMGWLLALPMLVGGFLFLGAAALLWRSFCEFYVAVFRISDDLRAIRAAAEGRGLFGEAPARPGPVEVDLDEEPAARRAEGSLL